MHACAVGIEEIAGLFFLNEKKKHLIAYSYYLWLLALLSMEEDKENLGSPCAKQRRVSLSLN